MKDMKGKEIKEGKKVKGFFRDDSEGWKTVIGKVIEIKEDGRVNVDDEYFLYPENVEVIN
jgi:hypothetical protein